MRRLAGTQISSEESIGDDRSALCCYTFVVKAERAQSGPVLLRSICDNIDEITPVTHFAKLIKRKKRSAGEVRLHPQHAVEFNWVPDGFMNLQSELGTIKDEIESSFRTLIRFM